MKRKIKVWGKLKIYEASAVGLPAYPDAHASVDSFSLIKALTNANLKTGFVDEGADINDELNLEEKEAMVEKNPTPEAETEPEKEPEAEPEKEPEKEPESEPEKNIAPEVKSDISEITKAIADGIKEGLKELGTERGLVEKQTPVKKSLGEMTMGMHNNAYNLNR